MMIHCQSRVVSVSPATFPRMKQTTASASKTGRPVATAACDRVAAPVELWALLHHIRGQFTSQHLRDLRPEYDVAVFHLASGDVTAAIHQRDSLRALLRNRQRDIHAAILQPVRNFVAQGI